MSSSSSESLVAVIFYSALGIATLVTSIVLAFRYVKNCTSPICSCTQDTSMSSQGGSSSSLAPAQNNLLTAIPNIIKTATSGESTSQTIADVVGDIATVESQPTTVTKSTSSPDGMTARVTAAVNTAMVAHTKAITAAIKKPADNANTSKQQTKKVKLNTATPVAIIPASTPRPAASSEPPAAVESTPAESAV